MGQGLVRARSGVDKGIHYRRGGRRLPNFSDYNIVFLYLTEKTGAAVEPDEASRRVSSPGERFVGFRLGW